MDERELVLRFVESMRRMTQQVGQEMSDLTGGSDLGSLLSAVNQRRANRKWQLANGTYYSVHGVGCHIRDTAGTVVDVDVASDGRTLIFEAGRVQQFAESVQTSGYAIDQIRTALQELACDGILIAVDEIGHHNGWYAAVDNE